MYQFQCDYIGGCFPEILKKLVETNSEELSGYCSDIHCQRAERLILDSCQIPEGRVFWMTSGTLANLCALSTILPAHGGVICTDSAHILTGEGGAIEATGHKLLVVKGHNGKLSGSAVSSLCEEYFCNDEISRAHMVRPAAVYITQPTEWGTVYSLEELKDLRNTCSKWNLPLYLDGARLAYSFPSCDVTLPDISENTDIFYIGGSKCGTLTGEAVVIPNQAYHDIFMENIRMRGGLISKGRLMGCQFEWLFEEGFYYRTLGAEAVRKADHLRKAFEDAGFSFHTQSTTNQLFPILDSRTAKVLEEKFRFKKVGMTQTGEGIYRFCTSWSTTDESVRELVKALAALKLMR